MSPFRKVLLTGATGYLGAHLLAELLQGGVENVTCLLRSSDPGAGLKRVRNTLEQFGLWQAGWEVRIRIICGNLGEPQLGLGNAFGDLAHQFDAIYHNGAHVNYILNYAQLKPTNVGSTQEIIRLAQAANIPLFYVSTLRLFDHRADMRPIKETDALDMETLASASGYAYSKAMAERLIAASQKQRLKAAVFRPGLLWGDGLSGIPNVNDAISRLLRGCIGLKSAPLSQLQVNLTSIKYAAAALVALSFQEHALGQTWHLVHDEPTRVNSLIQALIDYGFALDSSDYTKWVADLRAARASADNDLNPLLGYFTPGFPQESTKRIFDSTLTQKALEGLIPPHPHFDAQYLQNNIRGMIDFGFLEAPQEAPLRVAAR